MNASIDETKAQAFVGKVLADTSGLTVTVLAALGDRLGIWKGLADAGATTSSDLASRLALNERYVREWLGGMSASGYVAYDPETRRFSLPAEHVPVLAEEGGPTFFGGVHQMLLGFLAPIDRIAEAFRAGGGVPQDAYPESTYDGMDRFTAGWFENLLLQVWIPAAEGVQAALERGIDVADVGCGRGRALIKLAGAFPRSRFVGYDVYAPNIARARQNAAAAGVTDRVSFEEVDAARPLPASFDLITTFDVIHDAVEPRGIMRAIRRALRGGGTYLCLDINCSHKLEENAGPLGAFFHGASVLYCMTTSLAKSGAGLGTLGLHEICLKELASEAGFEHVRRLPLDNPFNNLYQLR